MEEEPEYKFVCDKCVFKCEYESQWINHSNTELHLTGFRKKRSDYQGDTKCDKCDYTTRNIVTMKKHVLNKHATLEQREKEFKFYCKICDFGTFYKDTIEVHNNSEKHKLSISRRG
jgi:hypothetical protein